MQSLNLIAPFNGINHFATILTYCKNAYARVYLTILVEINSSIKDKKSAKNDCVLLAELCFGERLTIKFADEHISCVSNINVFESVLNIPNQARDCFPLCWEYLFSGLGNKTITGDNIGVPVVNRNPILNIFFVYFELFKLALGMHTPRLNYYFTRELCPPLPPVFMRKLGSIENTFHLLFLYYHTKKQQVFKKNICKINSFVSPRDLKKCREYGKIVFLLLTNNPIYNLRIMKKSLDFPGFLNSFIFIVPHPKAPCFSPLSESMSIIDTRGICAELLVDFIVKEIKITNCDVTVAGSSSALLLFAHEANYNWQIIKSHLNPLLNKTDFFRYIRILSFERLCLKVSNSI